MPPLRGFPFLFGRAFIEAYGVPVVWAAKRAFPFLFGRAFIEAADTCPIWSISYYFPSFSEGLSLRQVQDSFWRDFIITHFPSFSEGLSLRQVRR